MRNKKRFMALALAAVLTLSQLSVATPAVMAVETESSTELLGSSAAESEETSEESDMLTQTM